MPDTTPLILHDLHWSPGHEKAADTPLRALLLNLDRVCAETGACVLFLHHSAKDATKGASGR